MSDTETKVLISGDSSGAVSAMSEAATAVKESIAEMKEQFASLNEGFESIQAGIAGIGAIFAGGIFKEMVESTQEWTESAIGLGLQLGISTEQASIYAVAIKEVGGTTEDFSAASSGLTRQLKTHEKALNGMGIATRDTNGDLLDGNTILFNAIDAVNSYAAGTDRNLAAQTAFGRGVTASSAILRLHREGMDEAAETTEKLNLLVGEDSKEAFERNRKAMADVNLIGQAMSIQIGEHLIPVLGSLADAFSGQAPAMAEVFGQVIVWVGQAVLGLWYGMKELGTYLGGFSAAVARLAHGDLAGFHDIMGQLRTDLTKMSNEGDVAIAKLGQLGTAAAKAGKEAQGASGDKKWDGKDLESTLDAYKKERQEQAQAAGDWDQKDLAADQAFWQAKLAQTTGATDQDKKLREDIEKILLADAKKAHDEYIKGDEEYQKTVQTLALGELTAKRDALTQAAAMGKISHAEERAGEVDLENQKYAIEERALEAKLKLMQFDVLGQQKIRDQELVLAQTHALAVQKIEEKANDESLKETQEYAKTVQALELGELDAKKTALEHELTMNKITEQQELAGEIRLANEKYAIELKALEDKLKLAGQDEAQQQKLKDEELLLEQKHAADVQKIVNKSEADQMKTWNELFSNMRSGFSSTIQDFLKGTTSVAGLVKGLFQDVGNSIIQMIANMAAQYLETSLMQIVMSKTSGAAIIGTLAAQAAAGAFASTAAIPYVGPELAPAAAATAYADTMAFQVAASAAGGYDIPSGVNPVTQLHAQEMVLPKNLANAVRGMTSGGGAINIQISALDGASVQRVFRRNGGDVAEALKKLNGRFMNG